MADIIDIGTRLEDDRTRWFSGTFGCTTCGHEHAGVAPFPTWAAGPGTVECQQCKTLTCLVVRSDREAEPWRMTEAAPAPDHTAPWPGTPSTFDDLVAKHGKPATIAAVITCGLPLGACGIVGLACFMIGVMSSLPGVVLCSLISIPHWLRHRGGD